MIAAIDLVPVSSAVLSVGSALLVAGASVLSGAFAIMAGIWAGRWLVTLWASFTGEGADNDWERDDERGGASYAYDPTEHGWAGSEDHGDGTYTVHDAYGRDFETDAEGMAAIDSGDWRADDPNDERNYDVSDRYEKEGPRSE